jgi:hypothetical protein
MDSISFSETPLTSLTPLQVESADELSVYKTELVNLDAFSHLTSVRSRLFIDKNPELENVDALGGLEFLTSLTISFSPRLRHLPEFTELTRLDSLAIYGNDSLENVPTLPKLLTDFQIGDNYIAVSNLIGFRPSQIAIFYNASLPSITLSEGWLSAGNVSIYNNDALTRIEFTKQRSAEQLVLINNASLQSIEWGVLGTIDRLEVHGNDLLDNAVFDSVRTFERQFEL